MSNIDVVEDGDTRVLLHIPPARIKMPSGGNFVLLNVFFAGIGLFFLFVAVQLQDVVARLLAALIITCGVAFRAAVTIEWLAMKYGRTLILLDSDRIVVRKILFLLRGTRETALSFNARVSLVEKPKGSRIYHVEVRGVQRCLRFGRTLPRNEQEWLVRRISRFISTIPHHQIPYSRM